MVSVAIEKGVDAQKYEKRSSRTAISQDEIDEYVIGPHLQRLGQKFLNRVGEQIDAHAKIDGFFYVPSDLPELTERLADWTARIESACICKKYYGCVACSFQTVMFDIRNEIAQSNKTTAFQSVQSKYRFSGMDVMNARIQPYRGPNDSRNFPARDVISPASVIIHASKALPDQAWICDAFTYKELGQKLEDEWSAAGHILNHKDVYHPKSGGMIRHQFDADSNVPKIIAFIPTTLFGNKAIHVTKKGVNG